MNKTINQDNLNSSLRFLEKQGEISMAQLKEADLQQAEKLEGIAVLFRSEEFCKQFLACPDKQTAVQLFADNGFSMFMVGAVITLLPLFIGYFVARKLLKMDTAETLGCICGSQTSTPALGAITSQTESQEPVIAYSTAYPIALIMMTVLAQLLVEMA